VIHRLEVYSVLDRASSRQSPNKVILRARLLPQETMSHAFSKDGFKTTVPVHRFELVYHPAKEEL
jgi:hypothetical protein